MRALPAALRLVLVTGLVLAATGCRDSQAPGGFGTAAIAIAPVFADAGLALETAALPVNRIRLTARRVPDGAVIDAETRTVDPTAEEWQISFAIALPDGADVTVIISIELINVTGSVESVQWSGLTDPIALAPGPVGAPMEVPVFRGPLDNLGVTDVTVTPDPGTVDEGSTLPLNASVTGGSAGTVVYWTSLDPQTATVSDNGVVTGVLPGTARIVATVGARTDTVTITVTQRVASVVVSPASATLTSFGATATFTARALDPRGAEVAGVTITLSVAPTTVAAHDGNGIMRAVGNGTATVTATARGVTGTGTLTVAQAPASVLVSPPVSFIQTLGGTVTLTAVVRDANNNPIAGAAVTWQSSSTTIASVSNAGVVTGLAVGTVTITARANATISGTATVTVGSQTLFSDSFEGALNWAVSSANRTTGAGMVNTAHPVYVSSAGGPSFPAAPQGSFYLWFGFPAGGNYMGEQDPEDSPGSGGTSTGPRGGTATSPPIVVPAGVGTIYVSFRSWFEIEGINPEEFDLMDVRIVDAANGQLLASSRLNPSSSGTGDPMLPSTSTGDNSPPAFVTEVLEVSGAAGRTVRIEFTFSTEDDQYNGFRGWIVDDVRVTTTPPAGAAVRASSPPEGVRPAIRSRRR